MGLRMKHVKKLQNPTEETKNEYRRLKKAAKKAIARAMKIETLRRINELGRNPNNVFIPVKKMKINKTDIFGGSCMRACDGTLYLNEKDRAKLSIAHMSEIMNGIKLQMQILHMDQLKSC